MVKQYRTVIQRGEVEVITTAQCTIYHYADNTYTRSVYSCHWQDTQADTVNKIGVVNAGSAIIYIPSSCSLPSPTPTKDLVIRGAVDFNFTTEATEAEISAELKELKKKCDVKVIMSVDDKTYGNTATGHYKISAK